MSLARPLDECGVQYSEMQLMLLKAGILDTGKTVESSEIQQMLSARLLDSGNTVKYSRRFWRACRTVEIQCTLLSCLLDSGNTVYRTLCTLWPAYLTVEIQ